MNRIEYEAKNQITLDSSYFLTVECYLVLQKNMNCNSFDIEQ